MRFIIGRRLRFSVTITDVVSGVAVNPANLTFTLRNEVTGAVISLAYPASPEITNPATGQFHCEITPANVGSHVYRWHCTGAVEDAVESAFVIAASRVI